MKFYIASLIAFTNVQDASDETPMFLSMTIPAFIPADSMEDAAAFAREQVFERWKPEEGWHTHQANIMALGETQYDAISKAFEMGVMDLEDEEPKTYNF